MSTYTATCTDDGVTVTLEPVPQMVPCTVCTTDRAAYRLPDGTTICTGCAADLDWVITPS